ncbi:MAG TPA: hypothetical protein VG101_02855 [Puia sp.]|jgi:hypothetical protein|nr:hypothetical protein [Puia sp.]
MFHLILAALLLSYSPPQDVRVAVWSTGTPDTETYESFAFWIKSGKRAYIRYQHGTSPDDIELRWIGPGTVSSRRGFWAAFPVPDSRTIFIAPIDDSTLLVSTHGHNKKYHWENENADRDSDCDICPDDATEATGWLRRYFWN